MTAGLQPLSKCSPVLQSPGTHMGSLSCGCRRHLPFFLKLWLSFAVVPPPGRLPVVKASGHHTHAQRPSPGASKGLYFQRASEVLGPGRGREKGLFPKSRPPPSPGPRQLGLISACPTVTLVRAPQLLVLTPHPEPSCVMEHEPEWLLLLSSSAQTYFFPKLK